MSSSQIERLIKEYSDQFDYSQKETVIILAAGHGKRIKSQTSKMLHKIWEVPTVERVYNACRKSLGSANIIIVVGIKADDVINSVGRKTNLIYAYQETQKGTGHAVQVALEGIDTSKYNGSIYVFPGDMGLIDSETIDAFHGKFTGSNSDMIVLTGIYEGSAENNYYGRIVRANQIKKNVQKYDPDGRVLEIIEYKDIITLNDKKPYKIKIGKKEYSFSKNGLLNLTEYNSGVFGFKSAPLFEQIKNIESNNVQNEIYLTDLIYLFNKSGYTVDAISPANQYVVMGFNNKSVLNEMEKIARKNVYDKLKDIITVDDPDDFFIDESLVEQIIEMDKEEIPLDIKIGKGVYVGKGTVLNRNLHLMKNVYLSGGVKFGNNVTIRENARLTCFYGQMIDIGDNSEIFWGNSIKGNVKIGTNCSIESGVKITGSDEFPVEIGNNVTVKGFTYILGCKIGDNIYIEHSVLVKKEIFKPSDSRFEIFNVKFYLPKAEGVEAVKDLK